MNTYKFRVDNAGDEVVGDDELQAHHAIFNVTQHVHAVVLIQIPHHSRKIQRISIILCTGHALQIAIKFKHSVVKSTLLESPEVVELSSN